MIKTNYHTHHELCQHAVGTTEDYVKHAIQHGFTDLGMSDHVYNDRLNDVFRMREHQFKDYLKDVREQRQRYQHKINIHLGLECEYLERDPKYYEKLFDDVEYLILGQHFVTNSEGHLISSFALTKPEQVLAYAKDVCAAIESGYFSMIAHPDLYMCGYDVFDEACEKAAHMIIQKSIDHQVPLEFNANGIRRGIKVTSQGKRYPYPREEFWKIASTYSPIVILSSDAHAPNLLTDKTMDEAIELMEKWNLKITEKLTFKKQH